VADRVDPLATMPVSPFARLTRRLLWLWAALVLAFLYLPIGFMVLFSFNEPRTPGLPITNLTLVWYEKALSNHFLLAAVQNSVVVAVAVALIGTTIGTMLAYPLARRGLPYSGGVRILSMMPMLLPGFLLGLGLLVFLRRVLDVELSLITVISGHLVFTVPFVVLIVAARLQTLDRKLEWAAADLGASPSRTSRHIILPLIWPAILGGALISITLSIDEFIVTFFTIGPQNTLPIYIYTQVKFGVTPEVNAIATLMLGATLGLLALAGVVFTARRRLRGREVAD
jgi:ABC-type spermidine/putrescine transport system permease subunit II